MPEQFTELPRTSAAIKELAIRLIQYLKERIVNTQSRSEWTKQNKTLLDSFFAAKACHRNFTNSEAGAEFLWDFTAYVPYRGLLLVAESEYDPKHERIAEDFDKLLYSNAPLKLMICRIETKSDSCEAESQAHDIVRMLQENAQQNCTNYSGGDVVIVYCVWWALSDGKNRDFAYLIQIEGEPQYRDAKGRHFVPMQ